MSRDLTAWPAKPDTPPGVEAVPRGRDGDRHWKFSVRYRSGLGTRPREVFDTVDQALAFKQRLAVARAKDEVAEIVLGDLTLDKFVELHWWPHARRRLAENTLEPYSSVYACHLSPHVGHRKIRTLRGPVVSALRDQLLAAGVSPTTTRRALMILQGICRFAVERGALTHNHVREVEKPPVRRRLAITPPTALEIEALRAELDPESALLAALMGFQGLRPSEALALEIRHIGESTLLVEQRWRRGRIVTGQKNSRRREYAHRAPPLYQPVREVLDAHVATLRRRGRRRLLFAGPDGRPWTPTELRRWRDTVFKPAVERSGVELTRPYHLRHGYAELLIRAHHDLKEIAEWMGNTPATVSRYYLHRIRDLEHVEPVPVEEQIQRARRTRT